MGPKTAVAVAVAVVMILWATLCEGFASSSTSAPFGVSLASSGSDEGITLSPDVKEEANLGKTAVTVVIAEDEEFVKPDPDRRKYRAIQLANGLQALLVSSPESDVEAGAVHVQAGHMDDPLERPGLAHFHEHMLFLGTEKYPSEEEYETFLNQNGGMSNAYTDMEDTNYYFSITPFKEDGVDNDDASPALHGALDRLSQFFIAPKFDRDMVDRELRAIDSEYRNSFTSDGWRNFMLLKSSASPDHPFSKFGCGSYQTLTQGGTILNSTHSKNVGSLPLDDLIEFWNTFYQTYNLRLCIVGRAPLNALQKSVEETFGALKPSKGLSRRNNLKENGLFRKENAQYGSVEAFGTEQLGKVRRIHPLVESRAIKIYFATPPLDDPLLKDSKPHQVISHLIGHESPGSLHSLLSDQGWITELSSGTGIETSDFSLFSISIDLTPSGMEQCEFVISLVFQWIAVIRNAPDGLMETYHNEMRDISALNFRFRENGDPTHFCSAAADLMFYTHPTNILAFSSLSADYDPVIAKAFLDRLTPENCIINIINSDFDSDVSGWETEQWYGARYRLSEIEEGKKREWLNPVKVDDRLKLPTLNRYIPTDFSLRSNESPKEEKEALSISPPVVLVEDSSLKLWHKLDFTWRVPKMFIRVSMVSPDVYQSPRTMTLNRIFEKVLNDDLNSFVYDAALAGCNYAVAVTPGGYRLSLSGYSEKLPALMDTVASRMLSLIAELKEGPSAHPSLAMRFRKAKEDLLRETKNYRLDSPSEVCNYNSRLLLEENVWYLTNYIEEMEGFGGNYSPLSMAECASIAQKSLNGRTRVEALCMGNVDEEGCNQVAALLRTNFVDKSRELRDEEMPVFRAMKLPTVSEATKIFGIEVNPTAPVIYQEIAFSESEENNANELTLQCGCEHDLGYEGMAIIELIAHLGYNSAYNQLRTKEQLGYSVSAHIRKVSGGAWSFYVMVQSSVSLPSVLEERSEAWLRQFRSELEEMDLEKLEDEANAVAAQLLERDTKLSQEVGTMWAEIMSTELLPKKMKTPNFNRVANVVDQLTISTNGTTKNRTTTAAELKDKLIRFFDKYLAFDSPHRRAMSSRVYSQKSRAEFDENFGKGGVLSGYDDIKLLKQYLSTYPSAPYWVQERGLQN